ncbi:tetratricopeptide repeat protein [Clostridium sp. BJN0013]|uniref:tetratricopeptide repeat protein n=1 Tax=Clostridium sp. BJN0013 TaxID=3236840 RepID=UPI0034C67819
MNTYYDILEIDQDASSAQIKKSYFKMVRKYPPERFSEKFMEIRKAYEILSNEKTREEYDSFINIPGTAREKFNDANEFFKEGKNQKAINLLEELHKEFPDILVIQSLLGEVCIQNNNNGKAIKIFEKLVKAEPDNASFAGYLAKSYLMRGWHKKAVISFKKAIELDEDNFSLWMGLSEAYMEGNNIEEAKEVLYGLIERKENEDFIISAYLAIFIIDLKEGNFESMKKNLEKLSDEAIKQEDEKEHIAWILLMVSRQMVEAQLFDPAGEILEKAEKISPGNEEIRKLKLKVDRFHKVEEELLSLEEDEFYDEGFVSFIVSRILPEESMGLELYIRGMEHEFLMHINKYRKYVIALSKKYFNLYGELKDFFEKAFNNRERNKMIKEHEKYFKSHKGMLEMALGGIGSKNLFNNLGDDEDYDPWQGIQDTYIREEPKIGRNDPCPCGSGKKYKKCCGK